MILTDEMNKTRSKMRFTSRKFKVVTIFLLFVVLICVFGTTLFINCINPTISMRQIIDWSDKYRIIYEHDNRNLLPRKTNLSYYGYLPPWIPECEDIYLDLGSNIGVMVRKLFEPERYPKCKVRELYNETFNHLKRTGSKSGLCALGFEPNPKHQKRLREIETNYSGKGWRVHFFPFAVSDKNEMATFYTEDNSTTKDWGASLFRNRKVNQTGYSVKSIRLAEFILTVLKGKQVKLVKMDLEGYEYNVLVDMLEQKVLCQNVIKAMFVEYHQPFPPGFRIAKMPAADLLEQIHAQACNVTTLLNIDDETYLLDNGSPNH